MYRVRDFAEERSRTLYVRLPHRIRDPKEVQELFQGDAKVKLPRQASRACHVIFPTLEEKIKGLKDVRDKAIDGKRIIALNPRTEPKGNRIKPKKIVVPKPEKDPQAKLTQSLFVSNIGKMTTLDGLKRAFPGCKSVGLLDANSEGLRSAFVKMESIQAAGEYLKKDKKSPVVDGNKLIIKPDTRSTRSRRGAKNKKLKLNDKDEEANKNKSNNSTIEKTVENNIEEENNESESESDNDDESE